MVSSVFLQQRFLTPHSLSLNKTQTKHAINLVFCGEVQWMTLQHCGEFQGPRTPL